MLSLSSVAKELACSIWLVRRLVTSGKLEAHRVGPRIYRVSRDALDRYLAEQKTGIQNKAVQA